MMRPLLSTEPRSDASLVWMLPAHAMKACTVLVLACVWIMSSAQQNVTTEESSKYRQRRFLQLPSCQAKGTVSFTVIRYCDSKCPLYVYLRL